MRAFCKRKPAPEVPEMPPFKVRIHGDDISGYRVVASYRDWSPERTDGPYPTVYAAREVAETVREREQTRIDTKVDEYVWPVEHACP